VFHLCGLQASTKRLVPTGTYEKADRYAVVSSQNVGNGMTKGNMYATCSGSFKRISLVSCSRRKPPHLVDLRRTKHEIQNMSLTVSCCDTQASGSEGVVGGGSASGEADGRMTQILRDLQGQGQMS